MNFVVVVSIRYDILYIFVVNDHARFSHSSMHSSSKIKPNSIYERERERENKIPDRRSFIHQFSFFISLSLSLSIYIYLFFNKKINIIFLKRKYASIIRIKNLRLLLSI